MDSQRVYRRQLCLGAAPSAAVPNTQLWLRTVEGWVLCLMGLFADHLCFWPMHQGKMHKDGTYFLCLGGFAFLYWFPWALPVNVNHPSLGQWETTESHLSLNVRLLTCNRNASKNSIYFLNLYKATKAGVTSDLEILQLHLWQSLK